MDASRPSANSALAACLAVAVPLRIAEYRRRPAGGPTFHDRQRVAGTADMIASSSDGVLFRGPKKGHAARVFNAVADALAVLAFAPGGVTFAGLQFEEQHPNPPVGGADD